MGQALEFLQVHYGNALWLLTAIIPGKEGDTRTVTFAPDRAGPARQQIERWQQEGRGVYYHANPPRRSLSRKAQKGDIGAAICLHVDLDAREDLDWGDPQAVNAEFAALRQRLAELPPPTVLIFSGGGYQALWALCEPVPFREAQKGLNAKTGKQEYPKAEVDAITSQVETINKAIARALGADMGCSDVSRLLRVPGTINFPNAKKRDKGRVPVMSELIEHHPERVYKLSDFEALERAIPSTATGTAEGARQTEPRMSRDELWAKLPKHIQDDIQSVGADRSRQSGKVVWELATQGCNPAEIELLIRGTPCAEKYENRLTAEIKRSHDKWLEKESKLATDAIFKADKLKASGLITVNLDEIEPKDVIWFWPGVLAAGKLTLVAAPPKTGKSQILAFMAALISIGGKIPVLGTPAPRGTVLILQAEDGLEDTLVPRLIAAGADLEKIKCITGTTTVSSNGNEAQRHFSLADDLGALRNEAKKYNDLSLIGIDPVTSYMGRAMDSNDNAKVRAVLDPLALLAEELGVPVVLITHLNKGNGEAMTRVLGSIGFLAVSRINYMVVRDKGDTSRRLMLAIGSNLGSDDKGYAFGFGTKKVKELTNKVSYIIWERAHVANNLAEQLRPDNNPEETSKAAGARSTILDVLKDGPVLADEFKKQVKALGVSDKTRERAQSDLRQERVIASYKGDGDKYFWKLLEPGGAKVSGDTPAARTAIDRICKHTA